MTQQALEEEKSSMCIVFYFQHNCICFPDGYRGYYGSDHRLHVKFPHEFCSHFDLPVLPDLPFSLQISLRFYDETR